MPGSPLAVSLLTLLMQGTNHPEAFLFFFFSQRTFWNFPFPYQLAVPTPTNPFVNVNSLWYAKHLLTSPTNPLKHRGSHQIQPRLKHPDNINPAQTHHLQPLNSQATPEPQESQAGWLKSCVPRYKYREIWSVLVLLRPCPQSFVGSVVGKKKALRAIGKVLGLLLVKRCCSFLLFWWNGAWLPSIHSNFFTIVA